MSFQDVRFGKQLIRCCFRLSCWDDYCIYWSKICTLQVVWVFSPAKQSVAPDWWWDMGCSLWWWGSSSSWWCAPRSLFHYNSDLPELTHGQSKSTLNTWFWKTHQIPHCCYGQPMTAGVGLFCSPPLLVVITTQQGHVLTPWLVLACSEDEWESLSRSRNLD